MNNTNNNANFDFDELARLAKENPDAFEDKRKQMIQEVIDKSSPEIRRRMQGLQWQIDQIRSTADNPMASCLKISKMMWDSAIGEDGLVTHLQRLSNPEKSINNLNRPQQSATITDLTDRLNKEKD